MMDRIIISTVVGVLIASLASIAILSAVSARRDASARAEHFRVHGLPYPIQRLCLNGHYYFFDPRPSGGLTPEAYENGRAKCRADAPDPAPRSTLRIPQTVVELKW